MAGFKFHNLPGISDVEGSGQDMRVSIQTVAHDDANGTVGAGPHWQTFTLGKPLGPDGDLPLQRVAVAATSDGWKSKLDEKGQWPRVEFTLDNNDGWNVSFDCTRLLIDGWRLQPSASGEGFEEVLTGRAFEIERRRTGQNPIRLAPRTDKAD